MHYYEGKKVESQVEKGISHSGRGEIGSEEEFIA
jgi:hypothetical protein